MRIETDFAEQYCEGRNLKGRAMWALRALTDVSYVKYDA
jgi:hypothetical protein